MIRKIPSKVLKIFYALTIMLELMLIATIAVSAKAPAAVSVGEGNTCVYANDCPHTKSVIEGYIPATCTRSGYTGDNVCVACHAVIEKGHTTARLGHSYGSWVTKTKPTCTNTGIAVRTCKCGAQQTKTVAALGHSYGCNVNVYEDGHRPVCTRCGTEGTLIPHNTNGNTTEVYSCTCGYVQGAPECNRCHNVMIFEHVCDRAITYMCKTCGLHTCVTAVGSEPKTLACICKHTCGTYVVAGYPEGCSFDGRTDSVLCRLCNTKLAGGEVIPAHGNAYMQYVYVDDTWHSVSCAKCAEHPRVGNVVYETPMLICQHDGLCACTKH